MCDDLITGCYRGRKRVYCKRCSTLREQVKENAYKDITRRLIKELRVVMEDKRWKKQKREKKKQADMTKNLL